RCRRSLAPSRAPIRSICSIKEKSSARGESWRTLRSQTAPPLDPVRLRDRKCSRDAMAGPPHWTLAQTDQLVIELLQTKFGKRLAREDPLDLLDLDSLSMAEFSVELERAFGVRVDEQILEARTVGELGEYIRSL